MVATHPETEITFFCNHCHAELSVPVELIGVRGPCPDCGEEIAARWPGEEDEADGPALLMEDAGNHRGHLSVDLFEKRGFRPVRMSLAVASAVAIFGTCYAMKSRRWVWSGTAAPAVAVHPVAPTTTPSLAPEPEAQSKPSPPVPVTANLQASTEAGVR